ncbi:MAG: hypothetical protein V3T88_02435 [Nitrosomonadaceae bacterium]
MTEQAAQDPNMPPTDETEVTAPAETEVTPEPEGQAETATAPVEKEGSFVNTDSEKVQARINKITAEKYAEKRRADEAERKLSERDVQPTPQPTQTGEPKLEDFDYDESAHTNALIDYKVNQKAEQIQQQQQQATSQAQAKQTSDDFNTKVAAFAEKATDYQQVVANIPQLPEDTLNAVMQSDKGPELAYYLGKHLDIADEIATASPMVAAMKLGQISAQLSAPVTATKTSAAPDPIEPIESGSSLSKNVEEMSMDEIYNS